MYKRRLIIFIVVAFILTGCTRITDNLDEVVKATMVKENIKVNTVSTGYQLYIPTGVIQLVDNEYNQKFKIKDRYIYLYVDTISYYYKNSLNYKVENHYDYYYKELNLNGKTGYVGVKKIDDTNVFCEIVYNYSKIEFYSSTYDLPMIMANALIIQNSIKFNDSLIAMNLENTTSDGREVKYELEKPKDTESTFSKYLQEYVAEETEVVELPDED